MEDYYSIDQEVNIQAFSDIISRQTSLMVHNAPDVNSKVTSGRFI